MAPWAGGKKMTYVDFILLIRYTVFRIISQKQGCRK